MVFYTCIRCGYETTHKSKMTSHLNRKFLCQPIVSDASIEKMYEYNLSAKKKVSYSFYENNTKEKIENNDDIFNSKICKYCFKKFGSYKNKWRHEKHHCKKKKISKYLLK